MIRHCNLVHCTVASLAFAVGMPSPARAQHVTIPDTIVHPARASYRVAASLSRSYVTSVDDALSPERYGGAGWAIDIRLARESGRRRVSVDGGVNVSSSLTTGRTSGGLPDVRFVVVDGRVGVEQRLRRLVAGGTSILVGVALDGRYAERTHHIAAPPFTSASVLENRGQDVIVTLQPTIELARPIGRSAIAYRLGVGAIGATWHAWAPIGSLDQPVKVLTPPSLLQLDNLLTVERPLGEHASIGVAYRLRLLRARSAIVLAESRHDVALSLAVRRGTGR